ncbi:MAG: long-chain fatty acid--CoA ligase [Pelagibacterales bacterium]|nr:long-chain fatty acid--CoA ligase [Pelagibacterales bacterium]
MKNLKTICDLVSLQNLEIKNEKLLNFKEKGVWRSFSNKEFFDNIFHFACGLKEIGLQKNQTIAIFSYQNPIWLIADLGSILAGATTVPIFHNISKENLAHEILDAEISYIFTDNSEYFDLLGNNNFNLKTITYGFKKEGSITFEELLSIGKKAAESQKYLFEDFVNEKKAEDLATIIYTSGSTGKPKGVEITHHNLITQIKATIETFPLKKNDVVLSFLPLAHIFERMVMMFYLTQGVSIYFADDTKNVGTLLKEVNPTLMTVVPRVLEKVYIRIKENVDNASGFKKCLGKIALKKAFLSSERKKNISDKIIDLLVYKKFRAALGSKMRMIICGGASLSLELQEFYKNIGINLYCGYGLTEASPVLAANNEKFNKIGTIGKVFPFVELKIADDGELLAKGDNIMKGYHKSPKKTAEVIVDGWLKTGDLAQIDSDGFVKIIGRKKELFKTANGKYVCPVPIEQKLVQNLGFLIGSIVIAEGKQFTTAILFPDFEIISKTKEKLKFVGDDLIFLKSEVLLNFVQKNLDKINADLNHWEQIQKFYIACDSISIESGEITPSMKLKRSVLEEKYKNVIDGFYI